MKRAEARRTAERLVRRFNGDMESIRFHLRAHPFNRIDAGIERPGDLEKVTTEAFWLIEERKRERALEQAP